MALQAPTDPFYQEKICSFPFQYKQQNPKKRPFGLIYGKFLLIRKIVELDRR